MFLSVGGVFKSKKGGLKNKSTFVVAWGIVCVRVCVCVCRGGGGGLKKVKTKGANKKVAKIIERKKKKKLSTPREK